MTRHDEHEEIQQLEQELNEKKAKHRRKVLEECCCHHPQITYYYPYYVPTFPSYPTFWTNTTASSPSILLGNTSGR